MTPIAVVIVNYNTRDYLRACLSTVFSESPSEVIVVDNASSDGSVEMVHSEFPAVVVQANKTNVGYGAAANQAIASLKAAYVLLLNADTLLQPDALRALSSYLDLHPRAAIVGPRISEPNGKQQTSCHPFPSPLNTLLEISILGQLIHYIPILRHRYLCTWTHAYARVVPWVGGAALGLRREAFNAVRGFDDSFFMYSEEVDLCYRLTLVGWQVHFAPVATIVHVGGASTAQHRTHMTMQLFASIILFYQRHYSGLRVAEVKMVVKCVMLARLLRDMLHLSITRDGPTRVKLAEDISAWHRVLLGRWPVEIRNG